MSETAGRRWCDVCKMFFPYGYDCDTSDKKHEWVVPAADLDALRERLEEAECLIQRVRGGSLSDVNDWNLDADRFLDAIQKGSKWKPASEIAEEIHAEWCVNQDDEAHCDMREQIRLVIEAERDVIKQLEGVRQNDVDEYNALAAKCRAMEAAGRRLDERLRDEASRKATDQNGDVTDEAPFPWTVEDEQVLEAFRAALAAADTEKEKGDDAPVR